MTDDIPAAPIIRPGVGHAGIHWSGDGGLGPTAESDRVATAGEVIPASIRLRAIGFAIDTLVLFGIAVVLSTFLVLFADIDTTASQEEIQREVEDLYPLLYVIEGVVQFLYNLVWNTLG